MVNFWPQLGIYVLYGNYGPHYVGLTREQGLGKRLKDHRSDDHAGKWERFSWFGFRAVLQRKDEDALNVLKDLATFAANRPTQAIRDTEALLIKAMGLTNKNQTAFASAREWKQVKQAEVACYFARL